MHCTVINMLLVPHIPFIYIHKLFLLSPIPFICANHHQQDGRERDRIVQLLSDGGVEISDLVHGSCDDPQSD